MQRRAGSEGEHRARAGSRPLDQSPSHRREARLALTDAGPEAGVALDALDVPIPLVDGVPDVVQRHVLAGAEHGLAHGWIFLPSASICTKVSSRRARVSGRFAVWSRQRMA